MKREDRDTLIAMAVIMLVFASGYACLHLYSGHNPYFSLVTSQSMQHDDHSSELGIIDTGDLVIVRDKSKIDIQTYLEGRMTGFKSFGDYGSVIIYSGDNGSSIIHRALLYLEVKEDSSGKYASISYLDSYPSWGSAYSPGTELDPEMLREDIVLNDLGYRGLDVKIDIAFILSKTDAGVSGYVTMGDNNTITDQSSFYGSDFVISGLVTDERILSIPVSEIPWLGCFKLLLDGRGYIVEHHSPNSIPYLCVSALGMLFVLFSLYIFYIGYTIEKRKRGI